MDKLAELNKRMDRIKSLMDASGNSIEQMLATFASDFVDCDKCPLRVPCDPTSNKISDINDIIDCYGMWLKYLEGNDE